MSGWGYMNQMLVTLVRINLALSVTYLLIGSTFYFQQIIYKRILKIISGEMGKAILHL